MPLDLIEKEFIMRYRVPDEAGIDAVKKDIATFFGLEERLKSEGDNLDDRVCVLDKIGAMISAIFRELEPADCLNFYKGLCMAYLKIGDVGKVSDRVDAIITFMGGIYPLGLPETVKMLQRRYVDELKKERAETFETAPAGRYRGSDAEA